MLELGTGSTPRERETDERLDQRETNANMILRSLLGRRQAIGKVGRTALPSLALYGSSNRSNGGQAPTPATLPSSCTVNCRVNSISNLPIGWFFDLEEIARQLMVR